MLKLTRNGIINRCYIGQFAQIAQFSQLNKFTNKQTQTFTDKNDSTKYEYAYNYGKKEFLLKTGIITGSSIIGSLCFASLGLIEPTISSIIGGTILAIGGSIGLGMTSESGTVVHKTISNSKYTFPIVNNSLEQKISYGAVITGISISISPLIAATSLNILIPAIVSSSAIYGGSIAYGYLQPAENMNTIKIIGYGGLGGLIGCSVVGISSHLMFGPNDISSILFNINTYMGIPIFMAISAYDMSRALKMYEDGYPDAIVCATDQYLNYINILIRMIEIYSKIYEDD